MELPQNIRLILEALRGGGHMVDGKYKIGPRPLPGQGMMPTQMDGYRQYMREVKTGIAPPLTYEEWMMQNASGK